MSWLYNLAVGLSLIGSLASMPVHAKDLDSGKAALGAGRYSQALQILLPLANSGNDEAQRLVGEMSYRGQGMNRSAAASFAWNEVAAGRGNMIAQYNLGYLYEKGEGVGVSVKSAIDWYTRAAMQGYGPAQVSLGDLYQSSDRNKAIYWYDQARQNGDEVALKKFSDLSNERSQQSRAEMAANDAQEKAKERRESQAQAAEWRVWERERQKAARDDTPAGNAPYMPSAVAGMARLQGIQREAEAYGTGLRASNASNASNRSQGTSRPAGAQGATTSGASTGGSASLQLSSSASITNAGRSSTNSSSNTNPRAERIDGSNSAPPPAVVRDEKKRCVFDHRIREDNGVESVARGRVQEELNKVRSATTSNAGESMRYLGDSGVSCLFKAATNSSHAEHKCSVDYKVEILTGFGCRSSANGPATGLSR